LTCRTREKIEGALVEGRLIDLEYVSAKGEETERGVLPESVWSEGGHEYFLGHCTLRNAERTFRLDRIRKISP
jgi:predicted DNA-binding transcriptional regulator YafY